jgi:branched-chain amino acid aminotransferase
MEYQYFSHNGTLLPLDQATVPLSRLEYSYGFGVYETIRVAKGKACFVDEHCARLLQSAKTIDLDHPFSAQLVQDSIGALIKKNKVETCNLKILLIGGSTPATATLDILCLNPLFPDRKLYKNGATCITYRYERDFPNAKTLNMLPSYLAYRQARRAGAYDALFINDHDCITEGTRTNFFVIKGRTLISPPAATILPGMTRKHVMAVARTTGFKVIEQAIPLADLAQYDGAFITSTSSKILPLISIDDYAWPAIPAGTKALMTAFDTASAEVTT